MSLKDKILSKIYYILHSAFLRQEESKKRSLDGCEISHQCVLYPKSSFMCSPKSRIKIGAGTHFVGDAVCYRAGAEIIIGEFSFVGENSKVWAHNKIQIGNYVLISHGCNIIDSNSHSLDYMKRRKEIKMEFAGQFDNQIDVVNKEIIIEDDVWIGANCTILKGVHIGTGAIIGSNTVVTKDVPAYCVIHGAGENIVREVKYESK